MKNRMYILMGVFIAPLVLGAVYVNEVEMNPEGTDNGYEWVELHNNGEPLDLNGWYLTNKAGDSYDLNSVIEHYYVADGLSGLTNTDQIISLYNAGGELQHATGLLSDSSNDGQTWSRVSSGEYLFQNGTKGEENVNLPSEKRLEVFSPQGTIYVERIVDINISSEAADRIDLIDVLANRSRTVTLCRECDEFGYSADRFLLFAEGYHEIAVKAYKGEETEEESVPFIVDFREPENLSVETDAYTTGRFRTDFKERNFLSAELFYGVEGDIRSQPVDCQGCVVEVDLQDWQGEILQYYLSVRDVVGHEKLSETQTAVVDTLDPRIESIDISTSEEVSFAVAIEEQHLEDVKFRDYSSKRSGILCTELEQNMCEASVTFSGGEHVVGIIVTDMAGHSAEEIVEIEI